MLSTLFLIPFQPISNDYIDKNGSGKVIVPWPGTVLHYYAATSVVRWEDFELEHEDLTDKFASFGNGVTMDGFVPDQYPWVHPPVVQSTNTATQGQLERAGTEPPTSMFGFPTQIWMRSKIKFNHVVATGISLRSK